MTQESRANDAGNLGRFKYNSVARRAASLALRPRFYSSFASLPPDHPAVLARKRHVLYGFGHQGNGVLGCGDMPHAERPVAAAMEKCLVQSFSTSWIHTVYITDKKRVYACGNNIHGAIGTFYQNSNFFDFMEPSLFKQIKAEQVVCGRTHTFFLTKEGILYASGHNEFGQMGTDTESVGAEVPPRETPSVVEVLNRLRQVHNSKVKERIAKGEKVDPNEPNPGAVVHISAGLDHTAALTATGDLYTWGYNIDGQLGFGDSKDRVQPEKNNFFKDKGIKLKQLSCTQDVTAFLTEKGHVYLCGTNDFGQGGLDPEKHRTILTPTLLDSIKGKKIIQVSMGGGHGLALSDKHEVYSWGWSTEGRLGREAPPGKNYLPGKIFGLEGKKVVQISAGGGHSLALTEDGKVYAWGYGTMGRLGVGLLKYSQEPLLVESLQDKKVIQVKAGVDHSFALVEEAA